MKAQAVITAEGHMVGGLEVFRGRIKVDDRRQPERVQLIFSAEGSSRWIVTASESGVFEFIPPADQQRKDWRVETSPSENLAATPLLNLRARDLLESEVRVAGGVIYVEGVHYGTNDGTGIIRTRKGARHEFMLEENGRFSADLSPAWLSSDGDVFIAVSVGNQKDVHEVRLNCVPKMRFEIRNGSVVGSGNCMTPNMTHLHIKGADMAIPLTPLGQVSWRSVGAMSEVEYSFISPGASGFQGWKQAVILNDNHLASPVWGLLFLLPFGAMMLPRLRRSTLQLKSQKHFRRVRQTKKPIAGSISLVDALSGRLIRSGLAVREEVSGKTYIVAQASGYVSQRVEDVGQGSLYMWTRRQEILRAVGKEIQGDKVDVKKLAATPIGMWSDVEGEVVKRAEKRIFAPWATDGESEGGE